MTTRYRALTLPAGTQVRITGTDGLSSLYHVDNDADCIVMVVDPTDHDRPKPNWWRQLSDQPERPRPKITNHAEPDE